MIRALLVGLLDLYRVGILKDNVINILNKKYGIGTAGEVQKQVSTQDATFTEKVLRNLPKEPNDKKIIKKLNEELNKDFNLLTLIVNIGNNKVMV